MRKIRSGLLLVTLLATAFGGASGARGEAEGNRRFVVEQILGGPGSVKPSFWQRLVGAEAGELFARPYGLAWEGEDLLVADPAAGEVLRIDGKGRVRARTGEGALLGPTGVAVCPFGVVVTDSRRGSVTLWSRELRRARVLAEGLERPSGVACNDSRIFVVESAAHHVLVLRRDGTRIDTFGRRGVLESEFNFPAALALDGNALWVGDTLNFRVQQLNAGNGAFLRAFGVLGDAPGETPRIKGLAVDVKGRIWVSDAYLDVVGIFAPEVGYLTQVGRPGTAAGEFSFPAGIAVSPSGRVAIADSLNRRVQVLRLEESVGADEREGAR